MICAHKKCGKEVSVENVRYKGNEPYHTACSYAHPEYDVTKGEGSPFTEITIKAI